MRKFDSLGFLPNEIFEKFEINNFSLLRDNLFLRNIKYNDIEILKLISFLVRDKNWNNYTPEIVKTISYNKHNNLHFEFDLKCANFEIFAISVKKCVFVTFYVIFEYFMISQRSGRYLETFLEPVASL